jgi:acetyl esterase
MRKLVIMMVSFASFINLSAQNKNQIVYKQIDNVSLAMDIYSPPNVDANKTNPAIVFFFGGGWKNGNIDQFGPHAKYLSKRGLVCFLADYRVNSRQNTTPFESLKDAKSAIRFVRKNAKDFHVDPTKIIASGGSAGGHLAAATALISGFNEDAEDASTSCVPNALVLFNPVVDNGPGGYGYERIGDYYKDFSPLHNIKKGAPPTIIFLGTADKLIPVETAEYYKTVMEKVGSRCDLYLYEGQGHGFFNFKYPEYYNKTVFQADKFLNSLGYLSGGPLIKTDQ